MLFTARYTRIYIGGNIYEVLRDTPTLTRKSIYTEEVSLSGREVIWHCPGPHARLFLRILANLRLKLPLPSELAPFDRFSCDAKTFFRNPNRENAAGKREYQLSTFQPVGVASFWGISEFGSKSFKIALEGLIAEKFRRFPWDTIESVDGYGGGEADNSFG